jgi:GntR family transcriptional regulator
MILNDYFGMEPGWDTQLLATDISMEVLQKASDGIYLTEQIESIPDRWKRQYFRKINDEQFQVSRPTVRAAIAYLANQGYLVTVKGKGTFVSKPKIVEDTTVFLESFSKEMATKGISVQTEVLEQRMIAADEEVASKLKVPCGDEVIKIVRLRYVKDSFHEGPIVYNISYFPKKFSFLLKCNFEEESLTGALTRNHVERHHLEKNIDAVLLEGKIARILGVEEKSLGILISAVCQEADRKHVMEYTLSYYPSKRNKFVLKINV